jgi:hypothetical protein
VWKPCHYAMDQAVELIELRPTAMSYIHKVFEHLCLLRIGIWGHTHTVTTTEVSLDL